MSVELTDQKINELKAAIQEVTDVAPKNMASDQDAKNAGAWLAYTKAVEVDADESLGVVIKAAHENHKKWTGLKKELFSKLEKLKDGVRVRLANYIAAGHDVDGYYTRAKYAFTVDDLAKVPAEYKMTVINDDAVDGWIKSTEGKQKIPGITISDTPVLYAKADTAKGEK